ncbi:MAG: alpha/beta hydrolase [Anaerorhabdus sp.]
MRVKLKDIDKELRLSGLLIKVFNFIFFKYVFKIYNIAMKLIKNKLHQDINYKEEFIDNPNSDKPLKLCIYSPKNNDKKTGILWIHGGGFVMGAANNDNYFIEPFVLEANCTVVSVEYRLSTEAPFPAALDDCATALKWLVENSESLNIKSNQIFVGGNSAGGNLCCALSILSRDKKDVAIAFQMPLYPMLDDQMLSESMKDNNAPLWNEKLNKKAWDLYLKDVSDVSAYASPSRLKNYHNLPPCFTYIGDIDPFYNETIDYVDNLKKANINAECLILNGCFHAFEIIKPNSKVAIKSKKMLLEALKYAQNNYFKEQKQ